MANEGTIRIHRSIGGTGAAFRVAFVPYDSDGEGIASMRSFHEVQHVRAFLKLLGDAGFEKLKQFVHAKPTFGTCAGAILLATEVENPPQKGLGALNIRIRRNAYGRQIDSLRPAVRHPCRTSVYRTKPSRALV